MHKLRTVDVWDTLLRRDCHPECVKLATAVHLLLGWSASLKPEYRDRWPLYHARVDTERRLAEAARHNGSDDEYEIANVLRHWLATVFDTPAASSLPTALSEFELSVEIKRSFPDAGIDTFLKGHKAERSLFLSDFYMSAEMLQRLLDAKGLSALVRDGIVSCDTGLNKRSGRIFSYVHAKYGISPAEHIHVGDNPWSDVDAPQRLGVAALHYLPADAHADRLERERLFSSREALFEHVRTVCNKEAARAVQGKDCRHATAFRLGADAAPLFIGFVLWIAEQAVAERLEKLCFLTREGEFFAEIFDAMFRGTDYFGHELPLSQVLAVSRLSTFAASMSELSIDEMSRIWNLFKSQSVGGLFATLGIDIGDFGELLARLGVSANDVIEDPWRNAELGSLFADPQFRTAAHLSISNQRQQLRNYLAENGVVSGGRVGVVDIGWRGTIQDNIALISPDTQFYGMYLGLRRFINRQPENVKKSAFGPNENISDASNDLFEMFAALEMLCASSHGSVVGYRHDGERTIPCRQISDEENAAFHDFTSHFQQGVLLAVANWRPYLERYVVSSDELRASAQCVWAGLRSVPGRDLAETFLKAPQHDIFGFGQIYSRNQVPTLATIYGAPFVKSRRRELIEFVRRVQWSAAISHLSGVGRFHRWSLLQTFRAANWVKRYRARRRAK